MQDPAQDLPLVAELDVEGQVVQWLDPDGTLVRVVNGRPAARADLTRDLPRQRRRSDADANT